MALLGLIAGRQSASLPLPRALAWMHALGMGGVLVALGVIAGNLLLAIPAAVTALVLFFSPHEANASPRHVFLGHGIGVLSGWLTGGMFGVANPDVVLAGDGGGMAILAAATAFAMTAAGMALCHTWHSAAAVTATLVAMGLIGGAWQVALLLAGLAILVVQTAVLHRAAGDRYPH